MCKIISLAMMSLVQLLILLPMMRLLFSEDSEIASILKIRLIQIGKS